jgi:DNA-binding transcriptional MocR family regulator
MNCATQIAEDNKMSFNWNEAFAGRVSGMAASEIRELLKLIQRPEVISFAGGVPDDRLFPLDALSGAYERVFRSNSGAGAAFQYSISEGYPPLRDWIAGHMARKGVPADADRILVTSGSQQALEFIGKLLIGSGDSIVVTKPTYLGALQAFSPNQPEYLSVATDAEGPLLDEVEAALAQKPKLFYLVPDFQNPSGVTVSEERRRAIVALCARYKVPLIEDAAYAELRYDGEPIPSLAAIDAELHGAPSVVLHCGTFSKTMVPGLRIGWVTGMAEAVDKLVLMKQAADLHSSTVNQMVLHDLVTQIYDRHIPVLIDAYRARRDTMLAAMEEHFPKGCVWNRPVGGMFVWVELPEGIDGAALLERAIREADVAFVPGAPFFADRSHRSAIRMSFVTTPPERIREGIRRIGVLLAEEIAKQGAQ